MELIAAPSRIFKHLSTWILLAAGAGDALHVVLTAATELQLLSTSQLAAVNGLFVLLATAAKLIRQDIPLTSAQKQQIVEQVIQAPTKREPGAEAELNAKPDAASRNDQTGG